MNLYMVEARVWIQLAVDGVDDPEKTPYRGRDMLWADTEEEARQKAIEKFSNSAYEVEITTCEQCPETELEFFATLFPHPDSTLTEDEQEDKLCALLGISDED